jgi:hypothetical protein
MNSASQLGFDALLASADDANHKRQVQRETGHLPSTMTEALPFYRSLIESHHAAMLADDESEAMRLKKEARRLAVRLNGDNVLGIFAADDAPGCVLERETAAPIGTPPLWGQKGDFVLTVEGMRVRIEMDGLFGICSHTVWPGIKAHAVDHERPFLSETGFRSFLGIQAELIPNLTPEAFAREVISSYVGRHLGNRLVAIRSEYRRLAAVMTL